MTPKRLNLGSTPDLASWFFFDYYGYDQVMMALDSNSANVLLRSTIAWGLEEETLLR